MRCRPARLETVFVKAVTHPGASVISTLLTLQQVHLALRSHRRLVKHRVGVVKTAKNFGRVNGACGVQRHQHRLLTGQRLQAVDQVVQANPGAFLERGGSTFVVPGGPSSLALGQHRHIGVQSARLGWVRMAPSVFCSNGFGVASSASA